MLICFVFTRSRFFSAVSNPVHNFSMTVLGCGIRKLQSCCCVKGYGSECVENGVVFYSFVLTVMSQSR